MTDSSDNRDLGSGPEAKVDEMLENMGDFEQTECPIDGCDYNHRSVHSVARHVSGSDTAKHIWENTPYESWRDFVRKES